MSFGGDTALGLCLRTLGVASVFLGGLWAGPLEDAVSLYKQKKYPEARLLLEPVAGAQPANPKAYYYLGMVLEELPDPAALDLARGWLDKAVKLEPENEVYLAEYAGVCLLLADRTHSFSMAVEGRRAMSEAIEENPDDLDAREGLMTFFAQAPWPLGNDDKALLQAGEIARRDARRGAAAYLKIAGIFDKDGRSDRAQSARKAAQNLAPAPTR